MASFRLDPASIQTMLSTELNSLANNAGAIGAEYDNSSNLFDEAYFRLSVTFGSNPTAGSTIDLFLLAALDGTNYTDYTAGASGYAPGPAFLGSFVLQAKTTIHRIDLGTGVNGPFRIPPTKIKLFALNKSGVAFPASGSLIQMLAQGHKSI